MPRYGRPGLRSTADPCPPADAGECLVSDAVNPYRAPEASSVEPVLVAGRSQSRFKRLGSLVALTLLWAMGLWLIFGVGFGSSWFFHQLERVGLKPLLGKNETLVLIILAICGLALLGATQYFRSRLDWLIPILGIVAFGVGYYFAEVVRP